MKKMMLFAAAIVTLTACENNSAENEIRQSKNVSFALKGDFELTVFDDTRALVADGKSMTDLWVMDYDGDGNLVQQMHQTADDAAFGSPSLSLSYGSHVIRFVASRGKNPQLSDGILMWESASDTFWAEYPVTVNAGTAAVHNVTLSRMSSRLGITINDAIPDGVATIGITPSVWYRGLNIATGGAAGQTSGETVTINIPASRIGTTGTALQIFCISPVSEWTANITVTARDADGNVMGQATITAAPFRRNRTTAYSGSLFSSDKAFTLTLDAEWDEDYTGEW